MYFSHDRDLDAIRPRRRLDRTVRRCRVDVRRQDQCGHGTDHHGFGNYFFRYLLDLGFFFRQKKSVLNSGHHNQTELSFHHNAGVATVSPIDARIAVAGEYGCDQIKFVSMPFAIRRLAVKIHLTAFLFAAVFIPSAFCQNSPHKYGGQLVLSSSSDPKSFNDIVAQETSTSMVTELIYEGLIRTNAVTLKEEPTLAERWSVSPDGLKWMFYLRKDVLWNDGQPFTADDVVFTFNDLIFNEEIPAPARDIFTIEGKKFKVEKVDDYTVKFTLPVKFAPFLRGMSQAILPKHKLQQAVEEGRFNFSLGIDTPPEEVVGTGPYKLVAYSPGERIVFKRNPHYWKKSADGEALPYIEKIIYLIVRNEDTAILKFLDGELDYLSVHGKDYPLLKPLEQKKSFTMYDTGPAFSTYFISNALLMITALVVGCVGAAFIEPLRETYLFKTVKKKDEIRFYGIYATGFDIGYLLGPFLLSSLLLYTNNFKFVFLADALFMLLFFFTTSFLQDKK